MRFEYVFYENITKKRKKFVFNTSKRIDVSGVEKIVAYMYPHEIVMVFECADE